MNMDQITTQILDCFLALSAIPRPSGGEAAVTAYLAGRLEAAGLSLSLIHI